MTNLWIWATRSPKIAREDGTPRRNSPDRRRCNITSETKPNQTRRPRSASPTKRNKTAIKIRSSAANPSWKKLSRSKSKRSTVVKRFRMTLRPRSLPSSGHRSRRTTRKSIKKGTCNCHLPKIATTLDIHQSMSGEPMKKSLSGLERYILDRPPLKFNEPKKVSRQKLERLKLSQRPVKALSQIFEKRIQTGEIVLSPKADNCPTKADSKLYLLVNDDIEDAATEILNPLTKTMLGRGSPCGKAQQSLQCARSVMTRSSLKKLGLTLQCLDFPEKVSSSQSGRHKPSWSLATAESRPQNNTVLFPNRSISIMNVYVNVPLRKGNKNVATSAEHIFHFKPAKSIPSFGKRRAVSRNRTRRQLNTEEKNRQYFIKIKGSETCIDPRTLPLCKSQLITY